MAYTILYYFMIGFIIISALLFGLGMMRRDLKSREKSRSLNSSTRINSSYNGPARYYYSSGDKV